LADFPLTGSGESYGNCGSFFTVGCLNVEEHMGMNLDGVDMEGKAYLERHKQSCHRALCPICWPDWANREKDKAAARLRAFVLKGRSLKPIHLMVSVPCSDWGLSLTEMRKKAYRALKRVHCLGGALLYHPKRERPDHSWYFSPHFHIIGYGWILDVRQNYVETGYIVKNIGIRKTVEGTLFYQMSHCGISPKHHSITWFGALSYGKLHVKQELDEDPTCPLCHQRLKRLIWVGPGQCSLPEIQGAVFYDDPSNWMEKPKTRWIGED
jgi:hypothetical protein